MTLYLINNLIVLIANRFWRLISKQNNQITKIEVGK